MSKNQSGSTGRDDLGRAIDYARQLVSAIVSVQACAIGSDRMDPSASDLKTLAVDAFRAGALKLFALVTGGTAVLDPVEAKLTEVASGTVGAHGAYGPNAHAAILRLADGVLSDLMVMGGGFDLGGINLANLPNLDGFCQKVAGVDRGELNRLVAEAEREYYAAGGRTSAQDQVIPEPQVIPTAESKRVTLFGPGDAPLIDGKRKSPLTKAQYDVVKTLIEAGPDGLTKDGLAQRSKHSDAVGVMRRLAKDHRWKSVLRFPGKVGGHYRVG
jgi:hypothetical protein